MSPSIPYPEETRSKLAFSLSVLLHVLMAGAVVLFLWHRAAPPPPAPKVFELVAGPPQDNPQPDSAATPDASSSALTSATFSSLPSTPNVEPLPQTQPQVPTPATSTPAPAKPVTAPPILSNKPGLKPPVATAKVTDLKSFQQSHPAASASTTPAVRRGTAPNVGLNVNNIINPTGRAGRGSSRGTTSQSGASGSSDDYVAKLIARLQQAFELPGGVSGLKADVRLTIAADGTVISAILVTSSGSDQFDAAVNAALQRLTHVEPPPGGQQIAYTFTYTPNG